MAKHRRVTANLLMGATLASAPVAAACDPGPSYQRWAATEGAAGRINLEDVQTAFRSTSSVIDFERMVNEIYEGDGIVLIRAEQNGESMSLEGWEDLNKSGVIENDEDDVLFSIVRAGALHQHEMRGYGANSYYHHPFGAGDFLFTYMMLGMATSPGGRYYHETSRTGYDNLTRQRATFRGSDAFKGQVSRNTAFFGRQASFTGSGYAQAGRGLSTSRQQYLSFQRSSGAFKTSGTAVRSAYAVSGFVGGGGASPLRGVTSRRFRRLTIG